jgi:hypothetical protein
MTSGTTSTPHAPSLPQRAAAVGRRLTKKESTEWQEGDWDPKSRQTKKARLINKR